MEKIWFKSYQKGVSHSIEEQLGQFSSLSDVFEKSFKQYSSLPAFHCMGTTINFSELDGLSYQFASYLQNELKLEKGDRIALMMPNILQYPIALFGALRAGLIVVNVNPLYTSRELKHQLNDSGAKAIVIFENACHVLSEVISDTKVKYVLKTSIGDMLSFPKSLLVNFVIKYIKKLVPAYQLSNVIDFKCALEKSTYQFLPPIIRPSDIAFLQYTGGTTGVAKGAMLSHRNILANLSQARMWIAPLVEEGKEIIITPLPLYHIFSLTANCFTFSSLGGLNVLIPNPRDMKGFIAELKKWKFTAFTGVNTLFNGLLNQEDFKSVNFSFLKLTLGGGMSVQRSVALRWKEITGKTLIEAYGLTETSPAACMNPMNLSEFNGLIGLPISSTDVVIKDDDENNLELGLAGEICIKGPQVMEGYWNRPDETAIVMSKDGYLKTGDIGIMNEDGYVKIVDRKKDMILISGFNVYPNEIEEFVVTHPKVFEAAAIGIPNEKTGEAIKLFIVKKDDTLAVEDVIAFCREGLTAYKVPHVIEFRSELPKSNVGKILRKDLRN